MALDLSKYGVKPIATPQPSSPAASPSGGALDLSKYGVSASLYGGTQSPEPQSFAQSVWGALSSYGSGVKQALTSADQQMQGAIQQSHAGRNPLETGAQFGAGAVTALTAPIAPLFSPIGKLVNAVAEPISNNPAVQNFANSPQGAFASRAAELVANLDTIAGAAVTPEAPTAAKAVGQTLDRAAAKFPQYDAAAARQATDAKYITSLTKEWNDPLSSAGPTFNKAKAVVEKSPDTPTFLAQQGIDPRVYIEEGKYATADLAQGFRDTAGSLSRDTLRPSLQLADYSTPKTLVPDFKISDNLIQAQGKGVTADDIEAIHAKIQTKLDALQRKYPNGMSLTDMHDEGITYNQNGKFSPVGDPSVDNTAIANRAIGATLKQAVEDKAPESVPVKAFNAYLSKYYRAADLLDAMDTKKAPVSFLKSSLRKAAAFTGAALGEKVGAGVVSAFAGYQIGKAIEHALENLEPRVRSLFVHNLEATNPPAFTAVENYIRQRAQEAGTNLKLPSPSYTPLGPRSQGESGVQSVPAAPGPVGVDPATGQFKKTYQSIPKAEGGGPNNAMSQTTPLNTATVGIDETTPLSQRIWRTTASKPSKAVDTSTGNAPTGKEGVSAQRADTSGPFEQTLYHGTSAKFEPADIQPSKGTQGTGIYLTLKKDVAEKYSRGGSVIEYQGKDLKLADTSKFTPAQNDQFSTEYEKAVQQLGEHSDEATNRAYKAMGFDGKKITDHEVMLFDNSKLSPSIPKRSTPKGGKKSKPR